MNTTAFIKEALQTGLESDVQTVAVDSEIDHVGEIAQHAIEIEDLYKDIVDIGSDVTRLATAADALNEIVSSTHNATVFISTDLPTVNATLETICLSAGIEAFDLDKAKENLKALWKTIFDAIKKLIANVTNFFASIFGGFDKLKINAELLLDKANLSGGVKIGSSKLSNPSYSKYLQYKGSLSPSNIVSGLSTTDKVIDETFKEVQLAAAHLAQGLAETAKHVISTHERVDGIFIDYEVKYTSDEFSGGYVVSPVTGVVNSNLFFSINSENKEINGDVERASRTQVAQIAKTIMNICDTVEQKKDTINRINAVYERILNTTYSNLNNELGVIGSLMKVSLQASVCRQAPVNYSHTLTKISKIAFNTCRTALQYGDKSLAA